VKENLQGIAGNRFLGTRDENERLGESQNEIDETIQNDHYDCSLLFFIILFQAFIFGQFIK
jgi:hypothetical protein